MKRFFFGGFIVLVFFLTIVGHNKLVSAIVCFPTPGGERCSACDLCGYCKNIITVPSNWESCRNCLYPGLTAAPATDNESLKINDTDEQAPTPQPGRWYTMIGCVNVKSDFVGGFTGSGAASSLVTKLLDLIFKGVGGIAFLYFIYGAFLMLTSQADPEKLNHGRRTLYGAIIGLVFSLSSVFLVNLIAKQILKIPGM